MVDKLFQARQTYLNRRKRKAVIDYPLTWQTVIRDWQTESSHATAWLTYSANYLFNTAGIRWALDPFSLFTRIGGGPQPNFAADLARLQLVVLSHQHSDHFDPQLLSALAPLNLTWIVPEFMLDSIPAVNVLVPQIGVPLRFDGLTLTPLKALHFRKGNGVPELGYLAEFEGKRWLFPGDTRSFDFYDLPDFGKLDGVFAHLWLGKAQALSPTPPLLDEFVQFFASFKARRIVLTHLYELGRDAHDTWTWGHYLQVKRRLQHTSPEMAVSAACMGSKVIL